MTKKFFQISFFRICGLIFLTSLISFIPPVLADEFGCCANPGAGLLSCSKDRLSSRDTECCPKPENQFAQYYHSAQNPSTPANYNDCTANFFFPNHDCTTVSSCTFGCCCSDTGGEITTGVNCASVGMEFHPGETQCGSMCAIPKCNDGIDNDNNGCKDFSGGDTGCSSSSDDEESGGNCGSQPSGCNNPNYEPKLSNLVILPAKGERRFLLNWQDECRETSASYEVYICQGISCTNFVSAGITNANSFDYADESLLFDTTYTFQIKARYTIQRAEPALNKTASLGNAECFSRADSDEFCRNNTAYFCDSFNKIIPSGIRCTGSQLCMIESARAKCIPKSSCLSSDDVFGFYQTAESCETNKYCFYDRSYSTVDSCFSCSPLMSCYDYKSESACSRDNCRIGSCRWKISANNIGVGVCISTSRDNCPWCNKKGTESLENLRSYNEIFDTCTQAKSDLLSEGNYNCFYTSGISKSCRNVVCTDYKPQECSTDLIRHDSNNQILNPSNDKCRVGVCQLINEACVKNYDGDNLADCNSSVQCESDYFAPNTTLFPAFKKGLVDTVAIQISDRNLANGSSAIRNSGDYRTYLCLEPCGSTGHPYSASTQSRKVIMSNLNIFDGSNGKKLVSLNEGINVIRYYSQDAAKNIETVKRIVVEAHANTAGPKIFDFSLESGSKVLDKYYTRIQKPVINVQFVEPAIVTFARFLNKKTGATFSINGNAVASGNVRLPAADTLPNGEYYLELNAKNINNIFMDASFNAVVVIDNLPPKLNISPNSGITLNKSDIKITLTFDELVKLDSIKLNSEDIMGSFSSTDNKFYTAGMTVNDGNKLLEISAEDYAGNAVSSSASFVVDANPTAITLLNPKFGVASASIFDLIIGTDNNAECKYSLDNNFEFSFMGRFTTTAGTTHTVLNFDRIASGDGQIHHLFVRCRDAARAEASKSFDLSVDGVPPSIKDASFFPNPIVELPLESTLTANSDKPVVCKYSSKSGDSFERMDGKFEGFDNNDFKLINRQKVNLEKEGAFTYSVACRSKAGLVSRSFDVPVNSDLSSRLQVISHTPDIFNSSNVVISVETNKISQCQYSETDSTARSGEIFGAAGHSHNRKLTLVGGRHTFYVVCKDQSQDSISDVLEIVFAIDLTGPTMTYVDDTSTLEAFPQKTCLTDRLRVKLLAEDEESKVKEYYYSLFKKTDNKQVLEYTRTLTGGEWIWVENLNLADKTPYAFRAKAVNFIGLQSDNATSDGITVDKSACAFCGDGNIDAGELCDDKGPVFGQIDACTDFTNFIGGTLGCARCQFDTTNCISQPFCGDKIINTGELCDDGRLGAVDKCSVLGFASGPVSCTPTCLLDTTKCQPRPNCGNGVIDPGEECDSNLGILDAQCSHYSSSFTGGSLQCNSNCRLDTSGCSGINGNCGNGIININEKCDGQIFGIINSCVDMGFVGGNFSCNNCNLDTSKCTPSAKCGNSVIDRGESCDGSNLGSLGPECSRYSSYFSNGNLACTSDCRLDTSACVEARVCGNGIIDGNEECDSSNFGNKNQSCASFSKSFANGTLSCDEKCKISTDECIEASTCNNGRIDGGETCDGDIGLGDKLCITYSGDFTGGTLKCTSCQIDTLGCIGVIHAKCGDGSVNQNSEECDESDLAGKTCKSLGFSGGNLRCKSDCKLDTAGCTALPSPAKFCGNSRVEQPNDAGFEEQCDKSDLGGKTCISFDAYISGTLGCKNDCTFSYAGCTLKSPPEKCGDGSVNQNSEECDESDLAGKTCKSLGFSGGNLRCTTNCELDTRGCIIPPPPTKFCGNSRVEQPNDAGFEEQCDKSDLGGKTCISFDAYISGTLGCKNDCTFSYGRCVMRNDTRFCGNNRIESGEECDGTTFGAINECTDYVDFESGILKCVGCHLDTSGCKSKPKCGNNIIDRGERCDTTTFGLIKQCTDYSNFISGTLGCSNNCDLDTTNCIRQPFCGDKAINRGEHCDDGILGGIKDCTDLGFASGPVSCASNCLVDTSKCIPKQACGNSLIDPGEECDGSNLGALDGQCAHYSSLFTGGNLKCSGVCRLDTSTCFGTNGKCGDGVLNVNEKCDGEDFGVIKDCTDYRNFKGGILKCNNCNLDTSKCVPADKCGNGIIDVGEECDGTNMGIISTSCASYSAFFRSGTIKCTSECKLDTFSCDETPKCGNSFLDPGETCDSGNFGNISDSSCSSYTRDDNVRGNITCGNNCRIKTSSCQRPNSTTITCRDRGDCRLDDACTDNSDCESRFCSNKKCSQPSCDDGIKNQGESAADCGGSKCQKCRNTKSCNSNSDCESDYCSFGICKAPDNCLDGKLTPGEADTDCGGICPNKCADGKSCVSNDDCGTSHCGSSICKKCEGSASNCGDNNNNNITVPVAITDDKDSDGDGMPDEWEIKNGFNPNDPNDAKLDKDGDGLTNFEEFEVVKVRQKSTDPGMVDTDGDGFSDKEEIDRGTNPVDAEDFPKSGKTRIIFFILGIIVLISGFGYLGYMIVARRAQEKRLLSRSATMPRAPVQLASRQQQATARQVPRSPPPNLDVLRRRNEAMRKEREKLLSPFGKEEIKETKTDKPVVRQSSQTIPQNAEIPKKKEKESLKIKQSQWKRLEKERKESKDGKSDDVFVRLRKIADESKKSKKKKKKSKS